MFIRQRLVPAASPALAWLTLVGGASLAAGGARAQGIDIAPRPSPTTSTIFVLPQLGVWVPVSKRVQAQAYYIQLVGDQPGQLGLLNVAVKLNRYVSLTNGYFGIREPRRENGPRPYDSRVRLAATGTLPLGPCVLSDRNLVERRFQETGPSTRYRNMLRAEDSVRLGRRRFTVYAYEEVFYDWRAAGWTLSQTALGATYPLGRRFVAEAFYLHQAVRRTADSNIWGLAFTARLLKPLF